MLRSRLVEVAATLDRLDRAGPTGPEARGRVQQAEAVLKTLLEAGDADRAERVLELLSRDYDPGWRERFAAGERSADPAVPPSAVPPSADTVEG